MRISLYKNGGKNNMFENYGITNMKQIDSLVFHDSIQRLNQHMRNKNFFKPYSFSVHNKENITENFASKNQRQSYYLQCTLIKCNFFEAGFSGSVFINCKFIDCNFEHSTFQSCNFRNCEINYTKKEQINSVNFSKSIFSNCALNNIFFNSANFGGAILEYCVLNDIKFRSAVFEDSILKNTFLKNIRFASQNFDFLTIENITTENVVIPFPGMPCIINGLEYLYNTEDNIRFTSCDGEENKRISKQEYLELMDDFEIYYTYTKTFFPLANILMAQKRLEEAIYVTLLGIVQSLKMKNYRIIYQFCKLIQNNTQFTIQHRKKLYEQIKIEIDKEDLSKDDYHILNMYIREIKELLLNTTKKPYLLLDIKSNIDSSESQKIAIFINEIETLIDIYFENEEEHYIEIRHNSLENFIVQITADPERLIMFLSAFLSCIGYTCQFASFIKKKADKILMQNKEKNNKNEDIKKKELAVESTTQVFYNCNIHATNINYNIFNSQDIECQFQSGYLNEDDK